MASMPDTQVSQWEEEKPCLKCGQTTSLSAGATDKTCGLMCKYCINVYQMLYRHVGGLPPSLNAMSPSAQAEFFRKSKEMIQTVGTNARWSMVKAALVNEVTRFKTEQFTHSVERPFLPLSVWAAKGFNTDDIQKNGEKRDNEVAGLRFSFRDLSPCLGLFFLSSIPDLYRCI